MVIERQFIMQESNEQNLHVGALWVIFMTASRNGDKQICSISRVSFLSESPTPNGLPKHSFIMVYKDWFLYDNGLLHERVKSFSFPFLNFAWNSVIHDIALPYKWLCNMTFKCLYLYVFLF